MSDDEMWYDAIADDDPEHEKFFDAFNEVGDFRAAIAVDNHSFRSTVRK